MNRPNDRYGLNPNRSLGLACFGGHPTFQTDEDATVKK